VITTDFFTHCWKSVRPDRGGRLAGCGGVWVLLFLLGGLLPLAHAETSPLEITQLRVERADDGVFLTAQIRLDLPAPVEDALHRGLALFFVAEAELLRDRWYWYDRKVTGAAKYLRLAYQPLTRRWRLNISPDPIGNAGLGVSFSQHFDSLPEALQAVQRISRWKIAETSALETEARHNVEFRFRLDMSQLPRPFQMGVVGQSDWNLVVARNVRIGSESPK